MHCDYAWQVAACNCHSGLWSLYTIKHHAVLSALCNHILSLCFQTQGLKVFTCKWEKKWEKSLDSDNNAMKMIITKGMISIFYC